ncbi:hypothetical protein [Paenibacillus tundrae]|uniref:2'-phosphotransferase n=1 Tax=Paenibacillus tundrae TaxID=528187 RepID=A0ABT9WCK5_9BACL|nr:hypothetical protein [Paenibacillus tundrae]MDQ0170565.1 hypothetical protein [Paenibacillus tundrae]
MPNFRSKSGSFPQACRGTSRESDAAGGEKAVKDALQRVLRHALVSVVSFHSISLDYGLHFGKLRMGKVLCPKEVAPLRVAPRVIQRSAYH